MTRPRDPLKNTQPVAAPIGTNVTPTTGRKGTAAARKSKRTHGDANTDTEEPAPAKKIKSTVSRTKRQREGENASTIESEQTGPTKKARKEAKDADKVSEPPELPAPARRSARPHTKTPGTVQKRKRRTKEEMAADKAKAEAEKTRKQELTKENRHAMIQMDVQEDANRVRTIAQTIRTFADLEREGDSDGEEFEGFDNVSSEEDTESGSDSPEDDPVKLKAANKALQKQIQALMAKVEGGKKKSVGGKKSTVKTVTFASGLRSDRSYSGPTKQTHVEISAGGLDDSDAEAVNPFPSSKSHSLTEEELSKVTQKVGRDLTRKNELVSVEEEVEEVEYVPHPSVKKIAAKAKATCPVQVKTEEPPRPVKTEKKDLLPTKATATTKTGKTKRLNGNSVRMADLPDFAVGKWRNTFLPTLYDKFFASNKPFDGFYKGSDQFVALLQGIVKDVFPNVEYEVTSSDSIHFLSYNRINEKRSSIASNAIKTVKQHIDSLKGEKAVKEWLRWCMRGDGPLFFKIPVPVDCPVKKKDPKSERPRPEGRLLSHFIISLTIPLLSLRTGSVSENGFPKGLIALVMALLERAVRHLSKPSEKLKDFSKDSWGSNVTAYFNSFHEIGEDGNIAVSDTCWKELVDACEANSRNDEEDTRETDLSILDNDRAFVFNFCSPKKPTT